ncbi:MAG: hypothetical protein AAB390_00200 [Patescibacteria group bacterium]
MKIFLLKIIFLFLITVAPLVAVNYIVDPLQCFRPAKWYKPLYDPNERVQSGCLARSQVYDTVITGSSHVENIDSAEVDRIFGVSSIRLTIAASTLFEQYSVLNLALREQPVKNVIWGLDTNILLDEPTRVRSDIVPFPNYIYHPGFLNNLLFLLDPYQMKHYAKIMINKSTGKFGEFENLRRLNSWSHLFTFSREKVLAAYQAVTQGKMAALQNTNETIVIAELDAIPKENVDKNVIDLVKNNPNTHFTIYFPPYSIVRFVEISQSDKLKLEAEWKLKEYLMTELLKLNNVAIFDFQVVKEITHNLDNYKDFTHYAPAVDEYILRELKSGELKLKSGESATTIDQLRRQLENFDLSGFTE